MCRNEEERASEYFGRPVVEKKGWWCWWGSYWSDDILVVLLAVKLAELINAA
jgi:hypothetical protein